jgi:hypothetical protein
MRKPGAPRCEPEGRRGALGIVASSRSAGFCALFLTLGLRNFRKRVLS